MSNSAASARSLVVLVLGEDDDSLSHPLPASGTVLVGRAEDTDIRIEDGSISRKHAALHVRGAELVIEDLGSENGTRLVSFTRSASPDPLETEKANAKTRLLSPGERVSFAVGQVLQLGAVMIVVQRHDGPFEATGEREKGGASDQPVISDPVMQRLHAYAAQVARSDLPVLLLGETGVGKEVFAETIHGHSERRRKPLLRLNCGAFTESLLESELFGHERGAFTGATQTKVGLLESASGGTVFLDEIGELTMPLQVKLLRVLEEQAVMRIGALRPRPIDVRFVAATNRDLAEQIARGAFREDLYFRVCGAVLRIPPLRDRPSEVVALAERFLARAAERAGRSASSMTDDARRWLVAQPWPGNVRELRNTMARASLLARGEPIDVPHLSIEEAVDGAVRPSSRPTAPRGTAPSPAELREMLDQAERTRVIAALEACAGNQSRAAKMLGMSRGTLLARMEAFQLPRPRKGSDG